MNSTTVTEWRVERTDTFARELRKFKRDAAILRELDKKIQRLIVDPYAVGGELSGNLHGRRSTRLARTLRLIFSIDGKRGVVYLEALDHRGRVYTA